MEEEVNDGGNLILKQGAPQSFVKWVGNKHHVVPWLMPLLPKRIHNYVEPCVGSGAMLFALLHAINTGTVTITGRIHINDYSPYLMNVYRVLKTQPDALISELQALCDDYHAQTHLKAKEAMFYRLRDTYNDTRQACRLQPDVHIAALFLFMIKACFRGLYREASTTGRFNTPFGHYERIAGVEADHMRAISHLLRQHQVHMTCGDGIEVIHEYAMRGASPHDLFFIDPPYVKLTRRSFVEYYAEEKPFEEKAQRELAQECALLRTLRRPYMLIFNHDTPWVRELYADFPCHHSISVKRTINAFQTGTEAKEIMIAELPMGALPPC